MTAKERYELVHFNQLPDVNLSINEYLSLLSKPVWVKMKYGILRGEIKSIDIVNYRITIKLENGKFVYICVDRNNRRNWIKERS